ncbi:DMT family transporter [Ciceribacter sp. L1K23]|uniref:DMT family transporter n=1 Tax=unclassified Ciceribacter TaxID=2628820 RepID=UPI001ABDFECE|nr:MULTISPECIES: DMT family transporter [unclassified Ciceribacter]MBO3760876.1 DMT family transporter [Ciceribacter sp. L1K22]MBR0555064.1 DMT family transporter [Ciceribacter sp. L1K23]
MAAPQDYRLTSKAWLLLVLLGLIWGGSFFFARIAVAYVPPFTLVLLRLSLAALALHVWLRGSSDLYGSLRRHWKEFLLMGLLNNALPHSLIFLGQTQIGAGLAAILNATTPIWTVIIAHQMTADEKLSTAKVTGCLLGLAGTMVLIGPSALALTDIPLWAVILPVSAALSYGFATIYGRRFRHLPPQVTATGQLTASSMIMLPVALLVDQPWNIGLPPLTAIAAILALAWLSTAYGYILFFRIMAIAGATNTSLVTLLVPPSAVLLGAVFLGERLAVTDLAGMLLIGCGLVVLDGRLFARRARPA